MASRAQVILEAVKLSIDAEGEQLLQLVSHQSTLTLELILRIILTYLPESLDFHTYYDLLVYLSGNVTDRGITSSLVEPGPAYDQLSDIEARQRVKRLHLLPLVPPHLRRPGADIIDVDPFTQFLIHRAHRIEMETGSLLLVAQLVEPFLKHSDFLRTWAISGLLPLLRLDYDYYASKEPTYSLEAFGELSGHEVVESLLSKAAGKIEKDSGKHVVRDIRGLVGPWMYGQKTSKRRKLETVHRRRSSAASTTSVRDGDTMPQDNSAESWALVNDWLLSLSMRDFPQAADAFSHWDGPQDVNYGSWNNHSTETDSNFSQNLTSRYAQTGLAMIYANDIASMSVIESSHGVLQRVAKLTKLASLPELPTVTHVLAQSIPEEYCDSLSPTHLFHNTLQRSHNPLTTPSEYSLTLGHLVLSSNHILHSFDQAKPCKAILGLAVFSSRIDQLVELQRILRGLIARRQDEEDWQSSRNSILRLRDWRHSPEAPDSNGSNFCCGLFAKVELPTIETEILKAMLTSTSYNIAVDTYCRQNPPLPAIQVERIVADAALAFYDSASNGNRTRGGVRKASEMLDAFRTFFPVSDSFQKISALLKATHAMSFYALTLQHGVPFQPVNIRAHRDPMLLVGKILDQNPRSYTKLDDLLDIGQNLVAASLTVGTVEPNTTNDDQQGSAPPSLVARRRIICMAIEAALKEEDFDTAYSYVVNRLQQDSNSPPDELPRNVDDTSWRAAFKAGCYLVKKPSGSSSLRRLEQRMELLSQALLLAPTSALCDILEVWRQCEEDLNSALTQEAEAEEKWDTRADRKIPGQFSSGYSSPVAQKSREPSRAATMNEEAPMGLFDVARGAAATLSKNASLLSSSRNAAGSLQSVRENPSSKFHAAGDNDSASGHDADGRVRKRDIVSNMVTGGLASGIGWVLGAPPVREHE